jgi:hypothetical protein
MIVSWWWPWEIRAQDFPWKDFERRTLQRLVKINLEESADDFKRYPNRAQFIFRGKILPSIIRVTYSGKSRVISAERKRFVELWAGVYSTTPNFANLFKSEFLFKEGAEEYWLPVAQQLIPHFEKELRAGVTVDLYVVRTGGIRTVNKPGADWLFLVEEFQTVGR